MKELLKSTVHRLGNLFNEKLNHAEFRDQKLERKNERSVEYRFVFDHLTRVQPDSILDVGTGKSALPQLMRNCGFVVTAIDNRVDYWPKGMVNRHYHILQDDITKPKTNSTFDFVTCISVLEHIMPYDKAVDSIVKLTAPNGHILLTFPYNELNFVENCYALNHSSYGQDVGFVCQAYSQNIIKEWTTRNRLQIVSQEYWQFFSGDNWTVGNRMPKPIQLETPKKAQLTCILFRK